MIAGIFSRPKFQIKFKFYSNFFVSLLFFHPNSSEFIRIRSIFTSAIVMASSSAGGEPADNLLDFFDLSKKFERVYIQGGVIRGKREHKQEEQDDQGQEEEEPKDPEDYWNKYKEQESQRAMRIFASLPYDPRPASTFFSRGTRMSGVERASMVPTHVEQAGERHAPLKDLYSFSQHRSTPNLQANEERKAILSKIEANLVTVISGMTGCGKTTQVPQSILEHYALNRPGEKVNIVVTQPRRVAAQTVARRVAEERGWRLGQPVGYKVGMDKDNCGPDTKLLYCTTGVLKKMIISKKSLHEWTHIILDEVHEREEDMDFLLLLCKKLLPEASRTTKLVLMSATINTLDFKSYLTFNKQSKYSRISI